MLTYNMQQTAGRTLYEHLYYCLRADIEAGRLRPHVKLPAKREFARHLGVSVITVEGAYRQLVAEGYAYTQERRGHFVAPIEPPLNQERAHRLLQQQIADLQAGRLSTEDFQQRVLDAQRPFALRSGGAAGVSSEACGEGAKMQSGVGLAGVAPCDVAGEDSPMPPVRGVFPYKMWARAMRQVLADESEESLQRAAQPAGSVRLRAALARHLRAVRGMEVSPEQIVVGAGAQTLYGLVVQLLGRHRTFALENPGYTRLAQVYRSNEVAVVPVGLDREGIRMAFARRPEVSVVHCMPSHQLPAGITMSARRRRELLTWADDAPDRFIVEDDYDCEFRMQGRPVPAMQAADRSGRVIYVNTFTKSLGPAFRIGYMVLPPALVRLFHERLGFYANTVGVLDQLTLARLLESGEYERHVNRQRTRYRAVQDALVQALQADCGGSPLAFRHLGAGLHFLLEVDPETPHAAAEAAAQEEAVAKAAMAQGVRVIPLARYDTAAAAGQATVDSDTREVDRGPGDRGQGEGDSFGSCPRPLTLVVDLATLDSDTVASAAAALARAIASVAR